LILDRKSASPADNDFLGQLRLQGRNSADESIIYSGIFGKAIDVTDGTEDGNLSITNMIAGTSTTTLQTSSGIVTAPLTGFYRNLITTATASFGDTILSTGAVFTDSYDVYEVYFNQIVTDTNPSSLWIRLLDSGGSNILTETYGYYNLWMGNSASDTAEVLGSAGNTTAWRLSPHSSVLDVGNASDEGFSGLIRLYNTRETSYEVTGGVIDTNFKSDDGYAVKPYGSVWRNSTTAAISGCQLQVFSVTISSGSLAVYGYKLGV
jgi:hypothetical protein